MSISKSTVNIISSYEAKLLDKNTISKNKIPPIILMEEAAEKILQQFIKDFYPNSSSNENRDKLNKIAVIAGWGNNGGDAISFCRKLFYNGIKSELYIFKEKNCSELNEIELNILKTLPVDIYDIKDFIKNQSAYSVIIDGIFGIGYQYRKDDLINQLFESINNSQAKKIAIDVPSGLNTSQYPAIQADFTYSIGYLKAHFFTVHSRKNCGKIINLPISFDINNITLENKTIYYDDFPELNKKKSNFVHKYSRGACLCIGGNIGQLGSILLSAEAAMQSGAGISCIISEKENIPYINIMSKKIISDSFENIENYLSKYQTIIIGPGLKINNSDHIHQLKKIFELDKNFILDASFFNLFKKEDLRIFKTPPLLTPHTKEFKQFFTQDADLLNSETINTVSKAADKFKCHLLLKDVFLVYASPFLEETMIFDNPVRTAAQAGSGDLLSGIIGGLICQQNNLTDSVIEALRIFYTIINTLSRHNSYAYSIDDFLNKITEKL